MDLTTRGDNAAVQVVIYPVGELVHTVQYSMVSRSIPNILLMKLKYKYADKAKSLQGLPVSYTETDFKILADRLRQENRLILSARWSRTLMQTMIFKARNPSLKN